MDICLTYVLVIYSSKFGVYPYHAASCNLFMDIDLVSCTNRSLVIVYLRLYQCNTAPPGPRWDAHFSVFFKFIQCTLTGCVFWIWDTRPWAISRHFLFVFFPSSIRIITWSFYNNCWSSLAWFMIVSSSSGPKTEVSFTELQQGEFRKW